VQDRQQHQRDRLVEVQRGPGLLHDRVRVAHVGFGVVGRALGGARQQCAGMRQHQRIVVDVHDPRLRGEPLRDLVGVVGGRQAGADVEELPDALVDQIADAAGEELPVGARRVHDARDMPGDLVARAPIGLEVVLSAEPVVPDTGRDRPVNL
jgi:hypothetical protein